jgi:hypothetical protein
MIMASTKYVGAMNLLQQSVKYSDLVLVCKGREFPVYRVIVCPHFTFFDAICSGGFKVSTGHFSFI